VKKGKAVRSRRKKKGKGKETLTGGSHMSATRRGKTGRRLGARRGRARVGPAGRGWAWPMRERGAGVSGPRAGRQAELWAAVRSGPRRKEIHFLFFF
jgi:hypothetical protein